MNFANSFFKDITSNNNSLNSLGSRIKTISQALPDTKELIAQATSTYHKVEEGLSKDYLSATANNPSASNQSNDPHHPTNPAAGVKSSTSNSRFDQPQATAKDNANNKNANSDSIHMQTPSKQQQSTIRNLEEQESEFENRSAKSSSFRQQEASAAEAHQQVQQKSTRKQPVPQPATQQPQPPQTQKSLKDLEETPPPSRPPSPPPSPTYSSPAGRPA